jgi:hypothetical protein
MKFLTSKPIPFIRPFIKIVIALGLLLPAVAQAKGDGLAFGMEGRVANVSISTNGESIHFTFKGVFRIDQYHDTEQATQHSSVEIDCKGGVSATVSQGDPFYSMTPDGRGGALRPKGQLLKILNAAVQHNRVVKFELYDVKIAVGNGKNFQDFTLTDATVVRATDADLK